MKRSILIAMLFLPSVADAQTDFNCMNVCLAQDYLYGLCLQQCSF